MLKIEQYLIQWQQQKYQNHINILVGQEWEDFNRFSLFHMLRLYRRMLSNH